MDFETLLVERSGAIATVTLNRPTVLNAMNNRMLDELGRLFGQLREDPATRFVVFTGAGRAFSAGADLSESLNTTQRSTVSLPTSMRLQQLAGQDFMRSLENLEQVTIAAVNGVAAGAGLALTLACDFRIASKDASFAIPEANVGLFFTWGCTPRLTTLIGPAKAKEMIMTCDWTSAGEALRIGLVNQLAAPDGLLEAVREMAERIAGRGPLAVRVAKKLVNAAAAPGFGNLYLCEPELVERLFLSQQPLEGVRAFVEKREPDFGAEQG
jgi:enoyl-CoA hydratase/carnithine racemase